MNAFLRSEPRIYGHNEDGPVFEDFAYVVVEAEDGRRWAHDTSFDTSEEAKAEKLCGQVQVAINDNGVAALNMDHWVEVDPRYGSEAHQRIGDYHLMDEEELREAY